MEFARARQALEAGCPERIKEALSQASEYELELFVRSNAKSDMTHLVHALAKLPAERQNKVASSINRGAKRAVKAALGREDVVLEPGLYFQALTAIETSQQNIRENLFYEGPAELAAMLQKLTPTQVNELPHQITDSTLSLLPAPHITTLVRLRADCLQDDTLKALLQDMLPEVVTEEIAPYGIVDTPAGELREQHPALYLFERISTGELTAEDLKELPENGEERTYALDYLRALPSLAGDRLKQIDLPLIAEELFTRTQNFSFDRWCRQGGRFKSTARPLTRQLLNKETASEEEGMVAAGLLHDVELTADEHESVTRLINKNPEKHSKLARAYLRYIREQDSLDESAVVMAARLVPFYGHEPFIELFDRHKTDQALSQRCCLAFLELIPATDRRNDLKPESVMTAFQRLLDGGLKLKSHLPNRSFLAELVQGINQLSRSDNHSRYGLEKAGLTAVKLLVDQQADELSQQEVRHVFDPLLEGMFTNVINDLLRKGFEPTAQQAGVMIEKDDLQKPLEEVLSERQKRLAQMN